MFVSRLHLVERDVAEAQVAQVRELRERHRERPDGAGDIAFAIRLLADDVSPFAALLCRLEIDLPGEVVEELVLDDALKKLRVLFALPEELRLRDARAGKGVRLNDIRSGFEEPAVDVLDDIGPRQREDVAVVEQILLVLEEAIPAGIGFFESILADRRAHRAVEHQDTLAHGGFEFGTAIRAGGHG